MSTLVTFEAKTASRRIKFLLWSHKLEYTLCWHIFLRFGRNSAWKRPWAKKFLNILYLNVSEKPSTMHIFIVAGVNGSESSSSTSHLLEERQDRFSDSMDDLFDQTAKDSSGLRRCKRRCGSSDKSLSKNPPSNVEIPPKSYSLTGAQDAGLLQIL